jgi:hypothetical protein
MAQSPRSALLLRAQIIFNLNDLSNESRPPLRDVGHQ